MKGEVSTYGIGKRAFEIGVSGILLLGTSPLLLLIAGLIKISSKGKVIYKQERLGSGRKPFTMYKFRTMVENAEKDGPRLAIPNDTRITKVGKTLRKYHLDELTQLWNVLKGDMSLVGPRPERKFYADEIEKHLPEYSRIFDVKPGITSSGMVEYGYASDIHGMVERSKYDLNYLDNRSAALDSKILIKTIGAILKGKGI